MDTSRLTQRPPFGTDAADLPDGAPVLSDVNHRVNNAFAVLRALVCLGDETAANMSSFADTLRNQVEALATANKYATEAAQNFPLHAPKVPVRMMIEAALAGRIGFASETDDDHAIHIDCPLAITLGPADLSNITMILYELATNAVKHGALRPSGGTVAVIVTQVGDHLTLHWTETISPPVTRAPQADQPTESFGKVILDLCASNLDAVHERVISDHNVKFLLQFSPQD